MNSTGAMNRFLQFFNFVGVIALAVLCVLQWQRNSQLDDSMRRLDEARLNAEKQVADDNKTLKQNQDDMEDLRHRLTLSESAVKDAQTQLVASKAQCAQLTSERDKLTADLQKWVAAKTEWDAVLKQDHDELAKAISDRDDARSKLNDMIIKYNGVVKDLDDLRAKH